MGPNRVLLGVLGLAAGFFLGVLVVFCAAYLLRAKPVADEARPAIRRRRVGRAVLRWSRSTRASCSPTWSRCCIRYPYGIPNRYRCQSATGPAVHSSRARVGRCRILLRTQVRVYRTLFAIIGLFLVMVLITLIVGAVITGGPWTW